jgi:collagenase-like PrtC family protease
MKLAVSDLWDDDFAYRCAENKVHEIYCSFRMSTVGSVRPAIVLPEVRVEEARKHIELVHSLGMKFSYVANASCLGNMEFEQTGRKKIIEFFEVLNKLEVDGVIIGIPILIELVKKEFPAFQIKTSDICDVTSAQKARFYEELGADIITISFQCNRNFEALKSIRKAVKCELEVIVTQSCLLHCPFHDYHVNIASHASQINHPLKGFYMDYPLINCVKRRLLHPEEIIKSPWIRPEDVIEYERIGIDRFKISNRLQPKEYGLRCVQAYVNRRYEGNLAELLNPLNIRLPSDDPRKPRLEGFTPEQWKMAQIAWSVPEPHIYIDNRSLDGFIEFFKTNKCFGQCGVSCNYCAEVAKRAVKINTKERDSYVKLLDQILSAILNFRSPLEVPTSRKVEVKWADDSKKILEELIQSAVPEPFRDVAKEAISRKAELYAEERLSEFVEIQDIVKAALSETPKDFIPVVKKELQNLGINF